MRKEEAVGNMVDTSRFEGRSILPIPYLFQEVLHVDFLVLHVNHPWMLEDAPWSGSAVGIFFQAFRIIISVHL